MDASSAKRQFNKAEALFLRKQYPEALELLTRLNNKFPNQRNIIYPMALCHEQLGRFDEARALCEELLRQSAYPKAKALLERLEPDVLGGDLVEGMDEAHPFAADGMDEARAFSDAPRKKQGLLQGFVERLHQRVEWEAQALAAMAKPRLQFNPSVFGDPVAMKTSWRPIDANRSPGRTLVQVSPERLEYRCSRRSLLFAALFLAVGAIITSVVIRGVFFEEGAEDISRNGQFLIGLIVTIFGLFAARLLYPFTVPMVFDKHLGCYWNSHKMPHQATRLNEARRACKLADVHALQLIQGATITSTSNRSTHTTTYYDLNLVLKSGRRLNIVSWAAPLVLRADGQIIAKFLNVPFWDALVGAQAWDDGS